MKVAKIAQCIYQDIVCDQWSCYGPSHERFRRENTKIWSVRRQ